MENSKLSIERKITFTMWADNPAVSTIRDINLVLRRDIQVLLRKLGNELRSLAQPFEKHRNILGLDWAKRDPQYQPPRPTSYSFTSF